MRGSPAARSCHVIPPPKQKPITASSAPGTRRSSSSSPARRSATSRSVGALPSAAWASPSLGMLAVPPSSESKSIANALYPSAASRGGIERMCGVSPRFSWITSTAPFGVSAPANTPIRSPSVPGKVISSASSSGAVEPLPVAVGGTVDPLDGRGAHRCRSNHCRSSRAGDPEQSEAANRLSARQRPGDAVAGDLVDEVGTECHASTVRPRPTGGSRAQRRRRITSSSIGSVSLPVNVFCWLGW